MLLTAIISLLGTPSESHSLSKQETLIPQGECRVLYSDEKETETSLEEESLNESSELLSTGENEGVN